MLAGLEMVAGLIAILAKAALVGRGVWCESYWLPEPDLVELRDGATVNSGCVVLGRGATLGPNSVILPGATIGRHATIGPASLVMRANPCAAHPLDRQPHRPVASRTGGVRRRAGLW